MTRLSSGVPCSCIYLLITTCSALLCFCCHPGIAGAHLILIGACVVQWRMQKHASCRRSTNAVAAELTLTKECGRLPSFVCTNPHTSPWLVSQISENTRDPYLRFTIVTHRCSHAFTYSEAGVGAGVAGLATRPLLPSATHFWHLSSKACLLCKYFDLDGAFEKRSWSLASTI
jgi:hypothetical protein